MIRRRTRVLHVIQNLNYGGMERLLAGIVRRADPDRFESHVLVLQYFGRFAEGLEGCAVLHLAPPMPRRSMLWPRELECVIARIAPDVVHSHSGVWYKSSLAARRAGVGRIVHTEHGRCSPDPWAHRVVDGLASRRTDAVVAVSDVLARQLADRVVADPRRVHVIRNGVDTEEFRPRASGAPRATLGIPADAPVIGSIGRLERIKGYDVMLEAFAILRSSWTGGPAPVLVVGGDGSDRASLEATTRERGVTDAVRLLGWRDDVHDLHAAFTLFTMSSRSEGTSVSLLEAMSAGLCPVVTDVGGNRDVLGPDLAHRLVPSERPEALAAAWRRALEDRETRERDAARARSVVGERFSLDAMVRAYEDLYAVAR